MTSSTFIEATSTYEVAGIHMFEIDVTAVVDWEVDDDVLDWEIVEFVWQKVALPDFIFVTSSEPFLTDIVSVDKKHPFFVVLKEGIDGKWLQDELIEKENIRMKASGQ